MNSFIYRLTWAIIFFHCFSSVFFDGFVTSHSGYAGLHLLTVALNFYENFSGFYDYYCLDNNNIIYFNYAHHPYLSFLYFGLIKSFNLSAAFTLKLAYFFAGLSNFTAFVFLNKLFVFNQKDKIKFIFLSLLILSTSIVLLNRNIANYDSFNLLSSILLIYLHTKKFYKKPSVAYFLIIIFLVSISWYNFFIIGILILFQLIKYSFEIKKISFAGVHYSYIYIYIFLVIVQILLMLHFTKNLGLSFFDLKPRGFGTMDSVSLISVIKVLIKSIPIAIFWIAPKNLTKLFINNNLPLMLGVLLFILIGFDWNMRHPFIFTYLVTFVCINLYPLININYKKIFTVLFFSLFIQLYFFRVDLMESNRTSFMLSNNFVQDNFGCEINPKLIEKYNNNLNWGRYVFLLNLQK